MALYAGIKVKTFIHEAGAPPADETADVGTLPKDLEVYIESLDSTNNPIISISHAVVDRQLLTTVVSGSV
tara:strand:- start:2298 stop:2507 length:210 start_codon:yes stop_codon:yes gene_type:complete